MKTLGKRLFVLLLFAALVVVLLWFQGILFRPSVETHAVPELPALEAGAETARVETLELASTRTTPGFVEAIDPAALAPRVMASVLEVAAREGDAVHAGEVLVRLDDRDARARLDQARSALESARAEATRAQLAFDRAERLRAADALTTSDWEAARAARDASAAQVERAERGVEEAETALSWFELTAPFDGSVLERDADPGDLATPGRPILVLWRPDHLRLSVAVPEELATRLTVGSELAIRFDTLGTQEAMLVRVIPASDARTGTVTLHLALQPTEGLRPGLLGRLELPTETRTALVIPARAVERVGQVERAHLVQDGRVVAVTIQTGKRHGDRVEVLAGLEAGEEVLVR